MSSGGDVKNVLKSLGLLFRNNILGIILLFHICVSQVGALKIYTPIVRGMWRHWHGS